MHSALTMFFSSLVVCADINEIEGLAGLKSALNLVNRDLPDAGFGVINSLGKTFEEIQA